MNTHSSLQSSFLQDLSWRGFIHQCTDIEKLDAVLSSQSVPLYVGFDLTADSLHVGHLLTIMALRCAQKHGHRPLVLLGGGTTKIGDPSGKDSSRKILSLEMIEAFKKGILHNFKRYLSFDGEHAAQLLDNDDWLGSLNYLEVLRTYGPHFTLNRMLTFESVKRRLDREQPLSFLEFNYMILQAIDFYHLCLEKQCLLQMGGSDQWGNIINGVELTRRLVQKEVFGLTIPLLTTANGQKMGKTATGAVWLSADKTSPLDFWQYWRNVDDGDVVRFLKLFTDLTQEQIKEYEHLEFEALNPVKKKLADEVTRLCHGEEALAAIHREIETLFVSSQNTWSIQGHDACGHPIVQTQLPLAQVSLQALENGLCIHDLLVQLKLVSSKSESRRFIRSGACKVNDKKIEDEAYKLLSKDLGPHNIIKLSIGKKRHGLIQAI